MKIEVTDDLDTVLAIRRIVFIEEQGVSVEEEVDGKDGEAIHLLAVDAEGAPIGTARMLANGHIGRMAVLPKWRGRGVGSAMLKRLLATARRRQLPTPFLNAQVSAVNFYRRLGFETQGEEFMDAGIRHRRMVRQ